MAQLIKAVTLDFTGTLASPYPSVGYAYAQAIKKIHPKSPSVPSNLLNERFGHYWKEIPRPTSGSTNEKTIKLWWENVAWKTLEPWCDASLFPSLFEYLWQHFANHKHWRPKKWAQETLQWLNVHGYKVAILTNFDKRIHGIIHGLGWEHWLQHIFVSSEISYEKPDKRLFQHVANQLQVDKENILHVGDDLANDYHGAKNAGWQAIWVHGKPSLSFNQKGVETIGDIMPVLLKIKNQKGPIYIREINHLVANLRNMPERKSRFKKPLHSMDKIMETILAKHKISAVGLEQAIMQHWKDIMGSDMAHRCIPEKIIAGKKLILMIANPTLRQEILFKKAEILGKLHAIPGCKQIQELSFKIG